MLFSLAGETWNNSDAAKAKWVGGDLAGRRTAGTTPYGDGGEGVNRGMVAATRQGRALQA